MIYYKGLTFSFIFSVIDLISSHIFLLNNLAAELNALLSDVIKTYSDTWRPFRAMASYFWMPSMVQGL